jgi:hypothetical protein
MATTYLASYDLRGHNETSADYADLINEIEAYGTRRRIVLSSWLIVSHWTAEQIFDDPGASRRWQRPPVRRPRQKARIIVKPGGGQRNCESTAVKRRTRS